MSFELNICSHLYKISKYAGGKNMIKNTNGIELKCQRDGVWYYTGNNQYYACCPKCKSSISIRKNKVVQLDSMVAAINQAEMKEKRVI